MHIFLTGEKGIGKSTIVNHVIQTLDIIPGGFRTSLGPADGKDCRSVYIDGAWMPKVHEHKHCAVKIKEGHPLVDLSQFNDYGGRLIEGSLNWAELMIMDECGQFEKSAFDFQKAVIGCLDQNVPVLGVLEKTEINSWINDIRHHDRVKVLEVTKNNREFIFELALGEMSRELIKNT